MDKNFDDAGIEPASMNCGPTENGIRGALPASLQVGSNETGITETLPASLQVGSNETGITETPHKKSLPEFSQHPSIVFSPIVLLRRRFLLTFVGVAVGACFAILIAGPIVGRQSISDRALIWLFVMSGPIVGTYLGLHSPLIICGWLGLILAPAHSIRPSVLTAVITLVGLGLWFYTGWEVVRALL